MGKYLYYNEILHAIEKCSDSSFTDNPVRVKGRNNTYIILVRNVIHSIDSVFVVWKEGDKVYCEKVSIPPGFTDLNPDDIIEKASYVHGFVTIRFKNKKTGRTYDVKSTSIDEILF